MDTDVLLDGEKTIDIEGLEECPICCELCFLDHKCPECSWKSCAKCEEGWRKESNSCPQCRNRIYDLDTEVSEDDMDEDRIVTHNCMQCLKVIFMAMTTYITTIIIFLHNVTAVCEEDDSICICGNIMIDLVIVFVVVKILEVIKTARDIP